MADGPAGGPERETSSFIPVRSERPRRGKAFASRRALFAEEKLENHRGRLMHFRNVGLQPRMGEIVAGRFLRGKSWRMMRNVAPRGRRRAEELCATARTRGEFVRSTFRVPLFFHRTHARSRPPSWIKHRSRREAPTLAE